MNRHERRQREIAEREVSHEEARRIVATGKCPLCGSPLRRNSSLAGWWQCSGYGSPGFRQTEHECSFQTFTE